MVEIITGTEPYLIKNYMNSLKEGLSLPEMNYLKTDKLSTDCFDFIQNVPFMDKYKVLVLETEEPKGKDLEDIFKECSSRSGVLFVISAKKIDKRSKFYKENKGLIKEFNKLSDKELTKFVQKGISEYGCRISDETLQLFLKRLDYKNSSNIDLYTVKNLVKQLCFYGDTIEKKTIDSLLPEQFDANCFQLFTLIVNGKRESAFKHMFKLLEEGESAIQLLSLVLRNFRICFKDKLIGNRKLAQEKIGLTSRQMDMCRYTAKMELSQLYDCMNDLQQAVNQIKNGISEDVVVATLFAKLMSEE